MKNKVIAVLCLLLLTCSACAEVSPTPIRTWYDSFTDGKPFRALSIEEQYRFTQELEKYLQEDIEQHCSSYLVIPDEWNVILNHRYAIPTEQDLSQEEALLSAKQYLHSTNLDSMIDSDDIIITFSFLADDPDHPQWKITFYRKWFSQDNRLYRILVPARGGDIQLIYDYQNAVQTPDDLLKRFAYAKLPQNMEDWSYLDKAAYGDMVLELMELYPNFNQNLDHRIYSLPKANELSYQDAIKQALHYLNTTYSEWDQEAFPLTSAEFVRVDHLDSEWKVPYWSFVFRKDDFSFYHIVMGKSTEGIEVQYVSTPNTEPNG